MNEFFCLLKVGYIMGKIPDELRASLDVEVKDMLARNFEGCVHYNNNLAGALQHEYALRHNVKQLEEFMTTAARDYWPNWGEHELAQRRHKITNTNGVHDVWVNFQRKHEFNPTHTHGGLLSFVIWHTIPYDIEAERKLPHLIRGNTSCAGVFAFNFANGEQRGGVSQRHIYVDKSMEGMFILFPATMQHGVYPFYTSDEYRVSISGNLIID